jgi:DNA polymerase III alpha subunit
MSQQMDEEKSQAESSQTSGTSQESSKAADGKELVDELTRLGQKFVEVVEVAWNSEQRKKIEEDLRTGLVSVANSLEDGFKRVSSTKEAQEAVKSAEDVAEKVRTSKIASELSEALAEGLRALSDQMDKLSKELKQKSSTTQSTGKNTASSKDTQDIPIARDDQP